MEFFVFEKMSLRSLVLSTALVHAGSLEKAANPSEAVRIRMKPAMSQIFTFDEIRQGPNLTQMNY